MSKREPLTGVWTLESADRESASDMLSMICNDAIGGDGVAQGYLRELWDGESWESIKNKLVTEGSTWYVWWMDGVNQHLHNLNSEA